MRYIYIYITACVVALSSCAPTYYYSTLASLYDDSEQTVDGDFITENDSVLVAYWFNGRNAPVYINVYNKSSKPLYVDWNKSALIVQDEAMSYRSRVMKLSDEVDDPSGISIDINGRDYSINNNNSGSRMSDVSFIPPWSRTTFKTFQLSYFDYGQIKKNAFKKKKIPNKDGIPVDVNFLPFTEDNSPLRFRSYLTLYKTPNRPFTMENEFYISSLVKTKDITPRNMPQDLFNRGDMFYIEKESKNKGFGEAVLGATLLVGAVALDIALSSDYDD